MSPATGVTELIGMVDSALERAHTQSLDLSFNELLDMKSTGELRIDPEFQRLFQWSEGAQSRFIESLLLSMPVPPIYMIEEDEGHYSLIDGLQRISSYLHLRGVLDAPHKNIVPGMALTLSDCDIVPALNGKKYSELGTTLQIRLKRAFIRVEVVKKTSDIRFKYHMFKRLNTGGEKLSDQQIRNCTIRLLDPTFNTFITQLASVENFSKCVDTLSEEQKDNWVDRELVLRFFAIKNQQAKFKHDVSDFLTEYMEAVSEPNPFLKLNFDYTEENRIFERTFEVFAQTLGEKSFGYPNKTKTDITKGFSMLHFEALSVGLQKCLISINLSEEKDRVLFAERLFTLKLNPDFIKLTSGGGKNSSGLLKARIQFVEDYFGAFYTVEK